MGFNGSWMLMSEVGANSAEATLNFALSSQDALGVSAIRLQNTDTGLRRSLGEITYTRLLARSNTRNAQSNLWFIGGLGQIQGSSLSGREVSYTPGIALDYETTRVYTSASARLVRAPGVNHDTLAMRAGFSFYEVDYEQTQPWLVIEARQMRNVVSGTEFTPLLRLINKSYFVEAGVSTTGKARLNFMYIY